MTRTAKWTAGTAVLAIVMSLAGWLLLISPQRSEAAELREAAASQRSINASLQVRLDELVAKSATYPPCRPDSSPYAPGCLPRPSCPSSSGR